MYASHSVSVSSTLPFRRNSVQIIINAIAITSTPASLDLFLQSAAVDLTQSREPESLPFTDTSVLGDEDLVSCEAIDLPKYHKAYMFASLRCFYIIGNYLV